MAPRFSLEHELRLNVDLAAERLKVASTELGECKGLPESWRLRRATAEHDEASKALRTSVDRLNAFVFQGKLPVTV